MKNLRKITLLILFSLLFFNTVKIVSAAIEPEEGDKTYVNHNSTLETKSFEYFRIPFEKENTIPVTIRTNASIDMFILNRTQLGFLLQNMELNEDNKHTINSINESISHKVISDFYEEEWTEDFIQESGLYLVVFNSGESDAKIQVQICHVLNSLRTLSATADLAVVAIFLTLSIYLMLDAHKLKKNEEDLKAKMIEKYSAAFMIGFVIKIYAFINSLHEIEFKQPINTWISVKSLLFSGNSDYFFTQFEFTKVILITGILMMIIIISNQIEAPRKKTQYFTIFLLIAVICFIIGVHVQYVYDIALILIPITVFAALSYISITYIRVIRFTSGEFQRKSLFIIIGFLGTFLMLALRHLVFGPQLLIKTLFDDIFSIIFLVIFYKGIK